MHECLELQIAENQMEHFEEAMDPIMRDHYEAEDCHKCEEFLQKGIVTYDWISRAEQAVLFADAEGIIDYTPELHGLIKKLHERWQKPCRRANEWIERVAQKGYTVDNLPKFRQCCDAVQDWIERSEWQDLSKAARDLKAEND